MAVRSELLIPMGNLKLKEHGRKSDIVYVLATKEKFQEKGFHTYTDWKQVDGLIT